MKKETNEFISELRQRNPAAQHRLLEDYGPAVFRLIQRIVRQQEDAEEVYQDVFVKVLNKISTFDSRKASLSTWISRIAYNESVNYTRKTQMIFVCIDDIDLGDEDEESQNAKTIDDQTVLLLEKAISELPATDRALLSFFYYDNMSLQEIAYITGSIPSTIGSRLSRIRKRLYRIIKHYSE